MKVWRLDCDLRDPPRMASPWKLYISHELTNASLLFTDAPPVVTMRYPKRACAVWGLALDRSWWSGGALSTGLCLLGIVENNDNQIFCSGYCKGPGLHLHSHAIMNTLNSFTFSTINPLSEWFVLLDGFWTDGNPHQEVKWPDVAVVMRHFTKSTVCILLTVVRSYYRAVSSSPLELLSRMLPFSLIRWQCRDNYESVQL